MQYVGLDSIAPNTTRLIGTVSAGELRSQADRFRPGDVLYGRLRPYLNKVYCADFEGLCSSEFIVFRKKPEIESKYLQYFLHSWEFVQYASHVTEGDRPRISFDQMAEHPFPLAPLAEQKRIVDAIEVQFTRLDAAVAGLRRLRANLQRYRQSVLKAACEGRLVPTEAELAHTEDRPFEDGTSLLQRVLAERRRQWEADNRPQQPKDDKWKDKYREPAAPDVSSLPELPDGWYWVTTEQVSIRIVDCLHSTPKFQDKGFMCVDTNCIRAGRIVVEKVRFVDEQTFHDRNRRMVPEADDVLFSREGALLGIAVPVPENFKFCLGQRMMIFRLDENIDSKFFETVLNSLTFRKQYLHLITGTASPHLNIGDIRTLGVPLPPLAEQERIVEEVERRLSVIEQHEQVIAASLKRAERLRQSILKRAFAGQL